MKPGRTTAELTEALYEAATGGGWHEPITALLHQRRGSSGSLMVFEAGCAAPSLLAMPGYSDTALDLYSRHYHSVDLWARLGRLQPSMHAKLGQEHVPQDEFERSEVWNDYAREHVGAFHLLGALFPLGDEGCGCIGLHRPRDQASFDVDDRAWLNGLLPHLRSALRLERRLSAMAITDGLAAGLLDRLAHGLVVARADGTVVLANTAAVALDGQDGPCRLGDLRRPIGAGTREATVRLRRLVQLAATGGAGGAVLLPREESAGVAALVTPLPAGLFRGHPCRGLALIVLTDLRDGPSDLGDILRQMYGLTPAEAGLATALAAGSRASEIADSRGVRMTTVRTQIRAVLNKTGCDRQTDLVRMITRLGALSGDRARGRQVVR